tara:strand:- start:6831 stop:7304 length:474 start_codon:yes stop_codon:yes gene_type:complete
MTMHLAQGMTMIRNRKYKPKMTKANIAKWTEGLRVKNKELKRAGQPKWTFEQYVDYCHGIQPKVDPRSREAFKVNKKPATNWRAEQDKDHRKKYPSLMEEQMKAGTYKSDGEGMRKKEPMKYTGDLIEGIATMHKSNAVPVMKGTNQAKDIARMRRG